MPCVTDQAGNISRYRTAQGVEGESQPGSRGRVLCNLLGISSKREMDQIEYERLMAMKEKYLAIIGPDTSMDVELICRMHRDWLGGVYVWAGEYRTVELSKEVFAGPQRDWWRKTWRRYSGRRFCG